VRVWDSWTFECIEVIEGRGDVTAIAAGPGSYPWRAMARAPEAVVESCRTGEAVAWFPEAPHLVATHPAGATWAGATRYNFHLFTLEGADPAPGKEKPSGRGYVS
jgi:hypothetical protein